MDGSTAVGLIATAFLFGVVVGVIVERLDGHKEDPGTTVSNTQPPEERSEE